ncbi:hypothetical protein BOTBODRAFT_35105 [Botryobasidium botryosum FD-172 SS1]|uniref:Uncharacterized protein n=1 Tax=Botryobasidium botryosum (strain FD-172 SS1) TaxID=930990 RepID=A0A067M7A5_BOTB1|nr:hypothetical protein BOTBODRAFT_35105 [Botryobasidium botryosum FD-172 SS1]
MEVAAVSNPPPVSHSNVHLHQIPDSILSALPGSTFGKPHRTHVTHTSSQAHWDIVLDNDAGVRVVLDVCGDHDAAFRAMARHFETYERDPDEVFKAPGEGRTHGQYSLESIVPGYAVIWVCGNVFVCVFSCTLAHITVGNERRAVTDVVADMIDKHLTDETVDPSAWKMPKIESVSTSELLGEAQDEEKKAYLGARFTVTATVSDSSDSVHASVTTGNVYLTETNAKDYKFTFLARSLGEDTITLTFSHPHTLAVVTHKLHVTVIAKD